MHAIRQGRRKKFLTASRWPVDCARRSRPLSARRVAIKEGCPIVKARRPEDTVATVPSARTFPTEAKSPHANTGAAHERPKPVAKVVTHNHTYK